jgi:predicted metal-dependent hydrolase
MDPSPEYDTRYLAGIGHFNRGDYFDAHEVWEDLWRDCDPSDRLFYQSLIQAAVALYHWGNGNHTGARRLFASGRDKMSRYRPSHRGLGVDGFWRQIEAALTDGTPAPQIVLAQNGSDHDR